MPPSDAAARLADADRRLARDPNDMAALIAKGDALTAGGDLRSATTFYNSALKLAGQAQQQGRPLPSALLRSFGASRPRFRRMLRAFSPMSNTD